MADSSSYKAPKVGEKHKYSNMINRTTSESIRLSDSDKILNHPTSLIAASGIPRKKTSFQITSVTVGGHPSNDGGDDSADDLDESHAEDISDVIDTSRATDIENETPSYSEDTFSKDDVFFNSSTSLGSAPVIPTSSQYGLAIVSTPDGCTNILNANPSGGNNPSNNDVSDNVINLGIVGSKHLEGDMRDLHSHTGRNERFKVVKIESTEPFKRGRWMCMDFLDHTMSQQHQLQSQGSVITNNDVRAVESSDTGMSVLNANQYAGTDSGISIGMSDHPNTVSTLEDQGHSDHTLNVGSNNNLQDQHNYISHSAPVTCQNSVSPGQTMQYSGQGGNMVQNVMHSSQSQVVQQGQSLTALSSQHSMLGTNQHQSLQPQQMQQVLSASNIHPQQPSLSNNQIPQSNPQIQQQNQQMQQPNQQIQQPNHQLQQPNQQLQQPNQQLQQPNQQLQQPNQQIQQPNQQIQQPNQQLQQPNQQIQQSNQQMQQNNQQMQQPGQQIQQTNQQIQQQTQQLQQPSQQFQQPNQQLQHQGMTMQHVHHQLHQSQPGNILPQQYQQPQMQQIHQQATLQAVQQNTQTMLQAQNSMPQHIQHQHMSMPVQQLNQGQMAMQIPQTVLQNQNTLQQIQQQATQLPVHSQMQGSGQHLQHVQMSMSGVVGQPSQVLPTQTSQPQQYHIHQTSQPMMQPGIQTQPNIMPVQSQYFSNTQITGANMNVQSMPNSVMQSQTQPNPNLNLQQNYSVNTMNQQQAQQIPIGHVIPPPTTIPHMNQPQIPTSGVPVMMTQPGPLPVVNNLSIPSTQNTIISPQGTSQGSAMVQQQYITQPVASLVGSSLASGGLQSYVSSTVNAVPSAVDNLQVYSNEVSTEHTVVTSNQPVEPSGDSSGLEEPQQTEDAESASGASAVAIDNKIEQAMDLVKSHLMFAVREEVEVLKEKIAELMDKINQLEMENAVLKANATQETLAQLSSSLQTPTSNAP